MNGDILMRPDLTFTDGTRFLTMPDLWALAQEPMPTDAEIDAANAAADEARP